MTLGGRTYGGILGLLSVAALQCNAVALVLETLGSDETLDLGGLGVWLLALTLGLNLTTDNKLANLNRQHFVSKCTSHTLYNVFLKSKLLPLLEEAGLRKVYRR